MSKCKKCNGEIYGNNILCPSCTEELTLKEKKHYEQIDKQKDKHNIKNMIILPLAFALLCGILVNPLDDDLVILLSSGWSFLVLFYYPAKVIGSILNWFTSRKWEWPYSYSYLIFPILGLLYHLFNMGMFNF